MNLVDLKDVMVSEFENPNIFLSESNLSVHDADSRNVIQIRCPHCRAIGTFLPAIRNFLGYGKAIKNESKTSMWSCQAHIRVCPNLQCKGIVFTLKTGGEKGMTHTCFPPERLAFDAQSVPEKLIRTLEEALSCHSVGAFRASVMMFRRLLEELCDDCGAKGKTLYL